MKTPHDLVEEVKKKINEISLEMAQSRYEQADIIIDVREPDEYNAGHVPNAINIPRGLLEFKVLDVVSKPDADMLIYCKTSGRAAFATQALMALGFTNPKSIAGGFDAWQAAGLPIDKPHSNIDFE